MLEGRPGVDTRVRLLLRPEYGARPELAAAGLSGPSVRSDRSVKGASEIRRLSSQRVAAPAVVGRAERVVAVKVEVAPK